METFEGLYSEVVKYVKVKFGLTLRVLKTGEVSFRESSDSTDLDVVSSLLSGKGKWSSDSCGECFKGDTAHFQRNRNAIKNTCKQTSGKGNQSKSRSMSGPSISGEGKSKENQRESKGLSNGTKSENKGAKVSCKGKTLELGQVDNDDRSWIHEEWSLDERNDGSSFDGWNDDGNGVEWREDCEQTHVASASSFSFESSKWEKMNLDTRVAVNSLNFGPEGNRRWKSL